MAATKVVLPVGFHQGKTLIDTSDTYPTVMQALLEAAQNGIDNDAMHIGILVDEQRRVMQVADNGAGASIADVRKALDNVNNTLKGGNRKKSKSGRVRIGRYGKGFFAPLTKCSHFTFISSPKGINQYMSFRFDQKKIAKSKTVEIEGELIPNMVFEKVSKGKGSSDLQVVDWATCVTFHNYVTDRMINNVQRPDDVIKEVHKKFGSLMNQEGILLSVIFVDVQGVKHERLRVQAPKFAGTPLGKETRYADDASRATFEMYLAAKDDKGKSNGTILMGDTQDPSTFSLEEFVASVAPHKGLLPDDVRDGLLSGHFEGEIRASSARMHKDRNKYIMDRNVPKLCEILVQWYEEVGRAYVERIDGAHKDERRQRLARETLQHIQHFLKQPEFAHLNEPMKTFKQGTIGSGHVEPEPEEVLGVQEEPSISTSGSFAGLKEAMEKAAAKKTAPKPKPKSAKPDHHPLTAVGPSGQKRTIVKESSLGLQIVHDDMQGRDELWILDSQQGILFFNIRHPVWVMCDGEGKTKVSDTRVVRLQETVVLIALQWLTLPMEQQSLYLRLMEDYVHAQAFLYQSSPSFNPGKKV